MSAALEKRPLIGLGDLLSAAAALNASSSECTRIAELLDFSYLAPLAQPRARKWRFSERASQTPSGSVVEEADRAQTQALEQRFGATSAGEFELVGPTSSARIEVRVPGDVEPLGTVSSFATKAPLHEPLFAKLSARNILAATLSVREEAGPIDAARLTDDFAFCRVITRVPRESSGTLRRGAVVLVDRSDALEPFSRDVVEVLTAIAKVLGRDRLTCFSFDGVPTQFSHWDSGESWSFAVPAGTPVLLIGDLGLRRPSGEGAWDAFAKRVSRAGCSLTALVPYPSSRWPEQLARRMRIVTWDRETTVAAARRVGART